MVLLGGLWLFVFNDGALCWGFPHFLPLIVLIPRGRRGTGSGLGGLYGTSKAADDFPKFITHVFRLETGPRALCGSNKEKAGASNHCKS